MPHIGIVSHLELTFSTVCSWQKTRIDLNLLVWRNRRPWKHQLVLIWTNECNGDVQSHFIFNWVLRPYVEETVPLSFQQQLRRETKRPIKSKDWCFPGRDTSNSSLIKHNKSNKTHLEDSFSSFSAKMYPKSPHKCLELEKGLIYWVLYLFYAFSY